MPAKQNSISEFPDTIRLSNHFWSHVTWFKRIQACQNCLGSKGGWPSGESNHLQPMWPRFKSQHWCHMLVEFVVGLLLCCESFLSGHSGFPLSSRTNTSKFQFDLERIWTPTCFVGKQITVYNFFYKVGIGWLLVRANIALASQIVELMTGLCELILKKYNSRACTNLQPSEKEVFLIVEYKLCWCELKPR